VVDYLEDELSTGSVATPCSSTLLLLDLKMPKLNGFEVLEWVRTQPSLKDMVVVVFSSSGLEQDKLQAYALGADCYVEKPSYPEDLLQFAQRLESFWHKLKHPQTHDP
jgi:two-component system response regulator